MSVLDRNLHLSRASTGETSATLKRSHDITMIDIIRGSLKTDVQPNEETTETLVCFKPFGQIVFWPRHTLFDTEIKVRHQ